MGFLKSLDGDRIPKVKRLCTYCTSAVAGITGFGPRNLPCAGISNGQTHLIGDMVRVEIAEIAPLLDGEILDVLPESRRKK